MAVRGARLPRCFEETKKNAVIRLEEVEMRPSVEFSFAETQSPRGLHLGFPNFRIRCPSQWYPNVWAPARGHLRSIANAERKRRARDKTNRALAPLALCFLVFTRRQLMVERVRAEELGCPGTAASESVPKNRETERKCARPSAPHKGPERYTAIQAGGAAGAPFILGSLIDRERCRNQQHQEYFYHDTTINHDLEYSG